MYLEFMMVWMTPEVKNVIETNEVYDPGAFNYDGTKLEKVGFINLGNFNLYHGEWSVFKKQQYGYGK